MDNSCQSLGRRLSASVVSPSLVLAVTGSVNIIFVSGRISVNANKCEKIVGDVYVNFRIQFRGRKMKEVVDRYALSGVLFADEV